VNTLKRQGYRFVTIPELLRLPPAASRGKVAPLSPIN
jgi:hypothetical protein